MREDTLNRVIQNNPEITNATTKRINPWLTIWYKPSQAFNWFIHNKTKHMILPLVLLGGFQQYLIRAYGKSLSDVVPLSTVLILAITLGSLFLGLFGLYLGSHLLKSTGKWLGGQGTLSEIQAAYACSYIPAIWAITLWLIAFGLSTAN